MNTTAAKGDTIEARLRYLGATDIQRVKGSLYFVTFEIELGIEVSYTYNINTKNKYFLQRIKPYPLPEGVFSDEQQIVEFIKSDMKKFKNAKNSTNFEQFLELASTMNLVAKDMESFFLNYNVDKEYINKLVSDFKDIRQTIEESKKGSAHVIV